MATLRKSNLPYAGFLFLSAAQAVYYDERLASHAYTGVKAGDCLPISVDAVLRGGFSVAVAGRRYGTGLTHEIAPVE